jgi:hypothetical protein
LEVLPGHIEKKYQSRVPVIGLFSRFPYHDSKDAEKKCPDQHRNEIEPLFLLELT